MCSNEIRKLSQVSSVPAGKMTLRESPFLSKTPVTHVIRRYSPVKHNILNGIRKYNVRDEKQGSD